MATEAVVFAENEILFLPVDKISPNPYQPRRVFEKAHLEELAASIKEFGVLQPVSVRLINGHRYELVAGERRLRACRLAGLAKIPSVIVGINDRDSAILALIENIQRENLNYIEEAEGFRNLIQDYNFTQEKLSEKLGKSQSAIANRLRLLRLSPDIKRALIENGCSERHARALLKLPNEEQQKEVLRKVIKGNLTVKKTESLIEAMLAAASESQKSKRPAKFRRVIRDMRIFTNTISQAVNIMKDSGIDAVYNIEEKPEGMAISILVPYPEIVE